ncbi:MAG: hypothetical protein CL582_00810 [Alteromonadaceae bacterium]|nr:hypothetical protein [Alteromonadaceae bacterium]
MLTRRLGRAALESIAFQSTDFFDEVKEAIQTLKDIKSPPATADPKNKKMAEWASKANLPGIVKKYTNLNVDFQCALTSLSPAYTMLPDLDRNHPLIDDLRRSMWTNRDARKSFKKAKDSLVGSIDLKNGKVSGVYTEIKSPIFIGSELIRNTNYTAGEIAAIFLHEVGHLITYYEYFGRSTLLTHVLGDLSKDFKGAATEAQKVEISKVAKEALDLDDYDHDYIESSTGVQTFTTMVVSAYASERRSATNSMMFDYRTTEALADQYVSRLGGGKDLAVGLDKMMRNYGHPAYMDAKTIALGRIVGVAIAVVTAIVALPIFLAFISAMLLIFFTAMPNEEYDDPRTRVDRIRKDYVEAMKRPNLTKEQRKQLQEDFDTINKLMNDIGYESSFFMFVWKTIVPSVRKQAKLDKELRQLENLANNDLFAHHNKLKTLA